MIVGRDTAKHSRTMRRDRVGLPQSRAYHEPFISGLAPQHKMKNWLTNPT
jgi:hypothetical protein